jgi:hypothetical protein
LCWNIRRYKDAAGFAKGDASVCYAKVESVPLALQLLDGSCLRATATASNKLLKVTKAEFTVKGNAYDPSKRAKVTHVMNTVLGRNDGCAFDLSSTNFGCLKDSRKCEYIHA